MITPRRVLRYVVPIDDQHHEIAAGRVLMATPQRLEPRPVQSLEVWVEAELLLSAWSATERIAPAATCHVQVFGTGQPLPDRAEHRASCIDGPLVWHVYEVAT